MKRLKSSLVAWSLGGSLVSFTALFYSLPYERFLDLALAVAFGVSFAGTVKYGRDAFRALRSGRSGAEFLIVAVFAMFSIILSQRVWVIVLRILDRPDWLVDSPIVVLIPWLLAWAMSLALIAPDIDLEPEDAKTNIWKSISLFIGGALAGFVIASSFSTKDAVEVSRLSAWPHLAHRPTCPRESVWVSSTGVYHTASSPYRTSIYPRHCFNTVEEAEAKGYRPPKGLKP
ncbi:hypothetical protein EON76_05275 [bacterium]|nr:MAG: hypothetical protein EON76_05275 [bacterium]